VRQIRQFLHSGGQPRLFSVSTRIADTERYLGADPDKQTGAVGFTLEHATAAATGELIERYCCSYCDPDTLVYASANELGAQAIGIDRFALYAPEDEARPGWPFARYRADVRINWVRATSLHDGSPRYVPACLVFIPYRWREHSDFLAVSVSSGNAAHVDPVQAHLTGLFEVVERDAFMITWLRQLELPRVMYRDDAVLGPLYDRHFADCGLEFHVFDMTLDIGVPSYVCLVEARSERGPFIGMGAATRLSPRAAIAKALLEAAQDMAWCRDLLVRRPTFDPGANWEHIGDFEDRVRLYCEPHMMKHVAFLLETPRTIGVRAEPDIVDDTQALQHCLSMLEARGLEALVVDQTAPDVARAGYVAPKVMIPGTVPLTGVHAWPQNGSPRLWRAPEVACYADTASPTLNPIPHPFP
jgi:ribosomal protein S12 methylthiotransferase accessory factor